jgi:predicted PurR-regulated permease PerM
VLSEGANHLLGIDSKAARVTWTAALTLLLLAAVYAIRRTLFIFAVALLLAYLLYPLVDHIGRRFPTRHRGPALALTYLLVIGLLSAIGIAIGYHVAAEARQLVSHPPDVAGFFRRLKLSYPVLSPEITGAEGRFRQQLSGLASAVPRYGLDFLAASTNLIYLVVIPIISFFMLKDGTEMRDSFVAILPAGLSQVRAQRTFAAIHDLLLKYMRALLLLCCTVLIVFSVVLTVLGVQYALLLASIAFFCEFVPVMGPLVAMCIILAVTGLSGYPHLLWVVAFLGAFRMIQDYVIAPRVMGQGVELHPLWVIFGVFAGDQIGGVAGVFLSVPALALMRLLIDGLTSPSKS